MFTRFAVAAIAFAGLVYAQAPGPRLVTVNVMVTKDKKPVKGLTKDDFTLEDKGKKVEIATFAAVEDGKQPYGALNPVISSNRLDSTGAQVGSATIILYDRVNNEQANQGRIRQQVLQVISGMKPTDRVGLFSLGLQGLTMIRDYNEELGSLVTVAKALLSNNAGQLNAADQALYKKVDEAMTPVQVPNPQLKVNATYPSFQILAQHLEGAPGRRNILWITNSFPLTFGDNAVGAATQLGRGQNDSGVERRARDEAEIEQFRQVLVNSDIVLHPVNPAGAGGGFAGSSLNGQQTFQLLADATGGTAYRSVNDMTEPLREVLNNTSYSYTLGFYPDAGGLDDKNHALKVTLAKKSETDKAKALHRKDYVAWGPNSASPLKSKKATLEEAMAAQGVETGIALMGVANPNPADPASQVLDFRVSTSDVQFTQQGDKWVANLVIGMGSDGGRMVGSEEYKAELSAAEWEAAKKINGLDIRRPVQVGAGAQGVLRLGIQDKATGNVGTVRIAFGGR